MKIQASRNRTEAYGSLRTEKASSKKAENTTGKNQDKVTISSEYRSLQKPEQTTDAHPLTLKMESAKEILKEGDAEKLRTWMEEWKKENQLEVNGNAAADPDRSLYATAYIESLVTQYEEQRTAVEAYYADAHKENQNSPYGNDLRGSLLYLSAKYQVEGSIYFRSDMSEAERTMAYHQEYALLTGGSVNLADPFALALRGGVPGREEMDRIAEQAARERVEALKFSKTRP